MDCPVSITTEYHENLQKQKLVNLHCATSQMDFANVEYIWCTEQMQEKKQHRKAALIFKGKTSSTLKVAYEDNNTELPHRGLPDFKSAKNPQQ